METIESLKAQGQALGYEGDALRAFVKDQQDRLRDERQEQRNAREMEARERELALKERELAEAKEAREREMAEAKEARERIMAEAKEARERETVLKEREVAETKEAREREMAEAKEVREREMVLKEREMAEAKEAHERELKKLQIQQSIEEKKHVFEMERLAAEKNVKPAVQSKEDQLNVSAKTPKIPAFDESKDEMDSYSLSFERYVTAQKMEERELGNQFECSSVR